MALDILLGMALGGLSGAVLGLIPFFVGRSSGRPDLGRNGLLCSIGAGASLVFSWALPAVVVGFVIAIVIKSGEQSQQVIYPPPPPPPAPGPGIAPSHNLGIKCISGPLMGQTYSVGPQGMIIGRDHDCAIRFPTDQPGISRHHCSLRWEGGVLMLTDMGSSHGTFLQNGTRLPAQFPTQLPANTRFYLVNTGMMFQVVII